MLVFARVLGCFEQRLVLPATLSAKSAIPDNKDYQECYFEFFAGGSSFRSRLMRSSSLQTAWYAPVSGAKYKRTVFRNIRLKLDCVLIFAPPFNNKMDRQLKCT